MIIIVFVHYNNISPSICLPVYQLQMLTYSFGKAATIPKVWRKYTL